MTRVAAASNDAETGSVLPPGYLERATLPFPTLILLFPFIVLYEVGTRYFTTAALEGKDQQIIAFSKMREFCQLFGATGRHMPALALVVILLAWHIARKDPWKTELRTLASMLTESIVLSLPLLGLHFLVNRYFPILGLRAAPLGMSSLNDRLIMDLGAGVYEEFVFRFVLFTLLGLVLKDIINLDSWMAYPLMVVISGVLFSLYHYWSPSEHFVFRIFAFRALAGIYFGMIFIVRGFGITAVSHSSYDVIVTLA